MRIKSFYASSVEGAVALAHRDLGPEAMLVQARRAPLEVRHLGEYEVVCAELPDAASASAPPNEPERNLHEERLARELTELRRQLDAMGRAITRSAWRGVNGRDPMLAGWHARLLDADLDAEFASEILDCVARVMAGGPLAAGAIDNLVLSEIEKRIPAPVPLGKPNGEATTIAALVGPPGSGKTSTIAKLAVQYGLKERRPVHLVSMDDYRVGGADQLQSYATILGASFQAFETIAALAQAVGEPHRKRLVLIDTPGYGPLDMDRAGELAQFLSDRPEVAVHLVLTASMKAADLMGVVNRFEIFRPGSLLFTRLDETVSFGTAFSVSARCAKPLSFFGIGQRIPDDLEPASRECLRRLLWPEGESEALFAA